MLTEPAPRPDPRWWRLARIAGVAVAYYTTARLGLAVPFLRGNVTPVWPPTGVALAALVLYGRQLWPGVAIGALLVNGISGLPLLSVCGMAVGNTLEAVVGAMLLERVARFRPALQRLRDVISLVCLAALASTAVSATIGVASLQAGGVIPANAIWPTWRVWWVGDALGALVVAPLVMTWASVSSIRRPSRSALEAATCGLVLLGVATLVFNSSSSYVYLVLPVVGWAGVRFGARGAATASAVVAALAVVHTSAGLGPFARGTMTESLWVLDIFLAVMATSGLVVAAVVAERDGARAKLREVNADLARRVEDQTAELRRDAECLAEAQRLARLGSWEWDIATGKITSSDEICRLFGFEGTHRPVSYDDFLDRAYPHDREMLEVLVMATHRSGKPFTVEHRVLLPDGSVRWLRADGAADFDEDGSVSRLRGTAQDITDQKNAEESLAHQASHDLLTGLPNRTLLTDRLEQALARGRRRAARTAVLFVDVDHFKWLNDSHGHAAGDRLLVEAAGRIQTALRPGDTLARFSGDEFVVVCEDLPDDFSAAAIAQQLAQAMSPSFSLDGHTVTLTLSIGIAFASARSDDSAEALLGDAASAMHRAKYTGRNRCEIFDTEMQSRAQERIATESALRQAIDRRELVVYYQPEMDLTTNEVYGVEALVRWEHPERGRIEPADFIPLAEETGLIVPLGAFVLEEACRQVAAWHRTSRRPLALTLSVNLSARQLLAPGLIEVVHNALAESGLPPSSLCLEITETVLLESADSSMRAIDSLRAMGVRIGVDDFGTGYASLTYLKQFPVDVLKIDKSFVAGLVDSAHDRAIVAAVVDLAHAFGMTTIGEGVETAAQLAQLRAIGCEAGQGYLWSPALPGDQLARWMEGAAVTPPPDSTEASGIDVLIVEDDESLRRMLEALLDGADGYRVVAGAEDGRAAVALAAHHQPDLVLLDLAMPGMGGLDALPLILAVAPKARIVVLSGLDAARIAQTALAHGAAGYLEKGADPFVLLEHLGAILADAQATR